MEQTEKFSYLGTEKIYKLMLKFSLPCILSLLVSAMYNIVDQIFIGNSELSTYGNAATGVVFPVFIIAQAFAWCVGDGCAAFLNICQGKNDTQNAHKSVGTGIVVTLICSLFSIAVLMPLKNKFLLVFGATENTIDYASEYFTIVVAFFPAYMLSNMINSVIRADGSPAWAMISMISGAVINIVLDAVFIFVLKMGMSGAAWATVIGQLFSFVISAAYLFFTRTFKLKLKSFLPDFKVFSSALKLGLSTFITQLTIVIVALLCNVLFSKYGEASKYGGDIPIAVLGIESKVFTVVANLGVGIVLGCQPIIGYNLGAKKYDRVKRLFLSIIISNLIICLIATLVFELAPNAVARMFGTPSNIPNPQDYWEFTAKIFRIFLSLITFTCTIKITSIFFQAVGKPGYATVASLIRDIICFIPLAVIMPIYLGIDGIMYAAPIADVIAMAVLVVITVIYFKKLNKLQKEEEALQLETSK